MATHQEESSIWAMNFGHLPLLAPSGPSLPPHEPSSSTQPPLMILDDLQESQKNLQGGGRWTAAVDEHRLFGLTSLPPPPMYFGHLPPTPSLPPHDQPSSSTHPPMILDDHQHRLCLIGVPPPPPPAVVPSPMDGGYNAADDFFALLLREFEEDNINNYMPRSLFTFNDINSCMEDPHGLSNINQLPMVVHQPPSQGQSTTVDVRSHNGQKIQQWTEDEHKLFLVGLDIYGRGNWKSISEEIVRSRIASQVASHAQKFYKRQEAREEDNKRYSIYDTNFVSHRELADLVNRRLLSEDNAIKALQVNRSRKVKIN
ncbi:hypothetical protein Dimus_014947 [Dionaea muscipula]